MCWRAGGSTLQNVDSYLPDSTSFLYAAGLAPEILQLGPGEAIFRQGDVPNAVFYLQTGRAKVTVASAAGREATIFLIAAGDFFGEEAIIPSAQFRQGTATSITPCTVLAIERGPMIQAIQQGSSISESLLSFLVGRSLRVQADLVDLLFNNCEKRLARTLLQMADMADPDGLVTLLPVVTQEALADKVGTTRSRINLFMNRFRDQGMIDYNRRIRVHKVLLRNVLDE